MQANPDFLFQTAASGPKSWIKASVGRPSTKVRGSIAPTHCPMWRGAKIVVRGKYAFLHRHRSLAAHQSSVRSWHWPEGDRPQTHATPSCGAARLREQFSVAATPRPTPSASPRSTPTPIAMPTSTPTANLSPCLVLARQPVHHHQPIPTATISPSPD